MVNAASEKPLAITATHVRSADGSETALEGERSQAPVQRDARGFLWSKHTVVPLEHTH